MIITTRAASASYLYAVAGAEPLRDPSRCEFDPKEIKVTKTNGRVVRVDISGPRVKTGRQTSAMYLVRETDQEIVVEPHTRNGIAPEWVIEVVYGVAIGFSGKHAPLRMDADEVPIVDPRAGVATFGSAGTTFDPGSK